MAIKRLISEEKRQKLINSKKYKGKIFVNLTATEKDELLEILAKKLDLL